MTSEWGETFKASLAQLSRDEMTRPYVPVVPAAEGTGNPAAAEADPEELRKGRVEFIAKAGEDAPADQRYVLGIVLVWRGAPILGDWLVEQRRPPIPAVCGCEPAKIGAHVVGELEPKLRRLQDHVGDDKDHIEDTPNGLAHGLASVREALARCEAHLQALRDRKDRA